ncbi:hypothetical protein B0J17DRAFT_259699 [Rhizoctonia solani]|nr:hypothetical protein B0J17DRAFT_259699 [Rhizoctonia solani]
MSDGDGISSGAGRPSIVRQLSGGIGLLSQPKSKPGLSPLATHTLGDTTSTTGTATPATSTSMPAAGAASTHTSSSKGPPGSQPPTTFPALSDIASFPRPSAATSSPSAPTPSPSNSLLFSSSGVGPVIVEELLEAPSPAPYISRSTPPPSEPQLVKLDVPQEKDVAVSPRTPPNLRLEIPPQDTAGPARYVHT